MVCKNDICIIKHEISNNPISFLELEFVQMESIRFACFADLQLVVIRCILIMHEHDKFIFFPDCAGM